MFRTLRAHHQEVELYCQSIWYRPLSEWPSDAQVENELSQHVEDCSGRIVKQRKCASSWSLSKIILRFAVNRI